MTCGSQGQRGAGRRDRCVLRPESLGAGRAVGLDFWSGPLHAALLGFRRPESLPYDDVPQVRRLQVLDAIFGPVTFIGVVLPGPVVEIAAFSSDPDYWRLIEDDPDD